MFGGSMSSVRRTPNKDTVSASDDDAGEVLSRIRFGDRVESGARPDRARSGGHCIFD
jgi:hypothetical protein